MSSDLTFIGLFLQASFIVQLVMLLLLSVSIASWTFIFQRSKALSAARNEMRQFEDKFWSGADLNRLYQELSARTNLTGMGSIFCSGFKEFVRLRKSNTATNGIVDGTYRAMRVSMSRQVEELESRLPFLATAGSISPYIGLFGTVWGIMNAFIALGEVQQATLAMVAPGIAEALIATAIGLFAAIPAVIAYNRFSHQVEKLENSYGNFMEEFSAILHRQAVAAQAQQQALAFTFQNGGLVMYVRKRRRPVSEINVVPYIDVMLVLLIIFMVTAPLISQGVKVDLPKASANPIEQEDTPPIIASVDVKGRYFLNVGEDQESPISEDELGAIVKAQLTKEPNTPVVVKGDGQVAYNEVIQLMVLLQQAGVPSVGLMTDPVE